MTDHLANFAVAAMQVRWWIALAAAACLLGTAAEVRMRRAVQ